MILKILTKSSPSYQSLIEYILQDGKGKEGEPPPIISHNLRSKEGDIQGYVHEFMQNEAMRQYPRKGNILLYHEILSFSRSDNKEVSNKKLLDIGNEYIKQRGIEGMYVGAVHSTDTHHKHIHFMVSGVKFRTGKAFRLSREDLRELKVGMQEYHRTKYPEIEHSTCEHGANKPYLTNKEFQLAQRTDRNTIKQEIQQTINTCYQQAKSQSEFLQLLQEQGLHHYERKLIPQGIVYDKYKFRFNRLGVNFSDLPITYKDMKKEQQTLEEIQKLREGNTPEREYDLLNEAYRLRDELELKEVHDELEELYEQKHQLLMSLEQEKTEELSEQLDAVIQKEAQLLSQADELSVEMEAERLSTLEKDNPFDDRDVDDDLEREEDVDLTDDLEELRNEREEKELDEDIEKEY